MPDEVAHEHSVLSDEASREVHVTDYTAVPKMAAELQRVYTLPGPRLYKQVSAVLALLPVVLKATWPDPRAARQVLDLLPPQGLSHYRHLMRGMVAAAVAWLRAAEMENTEAETWFCRQIKRLEPPYILGFTAKQAVRWFYDSTEKLPDTGRYRSPEVTIGALKQYGPDPSEPPDKYQATAKATELLEAVCLMNPVPLVKLRPSKTSP